MTHKIDPRPEDSLMCGLSQAWSDYQEMACYTASGIKLYGFAMANWQMVRAFYIYLEKL